MKLPSRGVLIIIGVVLVLIIAGGSAFFALRPHDTNPAVAVATASPSPTNTRLYPNAGPDVAKTIKKLETAPKTVMSTDALAQYGDDIEKAIPQGSTITPQPKTWKPDGVGGGVMAAVMKRPDGTTQTFLVLMVKQDGQWKVQTTYTNTGSN